MCRHRLRDRSFLHALWTGHQRTQTKRQHGVGGVLRSTCASSPFFASALHHQTVLQKRHLRSNESQPTGSLFSIGDAASAATTHPDTTCSAWHSSSLPYFFYIVHTILRANASPAMFFFANLNVYFSKNMVLLRLIPMKNMYPQGCMRQGNNRRFCETDHCIEIRMSPIRISIQPAFCMAPAHKPVSLNRDTRVSHTAHVPFDAYDTTHDIYCGMRYC